MIIKIQKNNAAEASKRQMQNKILKNETYKENNNEKI